MQLGLKDKVALVTGGTRGLGHAICLALAEEGTRVAVNARLTDPKPLVEELKSRFGIAACSVPGDITQTRVAHEITDRIERELGSLDILINNAGIWPQALVKDMSAEEWTRTLEVNLTAPFLLCREVVRRWLPTHHPGRIVNITSQAAFHGSTTGHSHYAAAKAGLTTFTRSLARELAPHNIRVNAVAPGFMKTDMAAEALAKNGAKYLERIPLGRIADPAEVAAAVVFLASDRASYITGATLHVNGGMLMR